MCAAHCSLDRSLHCLPCNSQHLKRVLGLSSMHCRSCLLHCAGVGWPSRPSDHTLPPEQQFKYSNMGQEAGSGRAGGTMPCDEAVWVHLARPSVAFRLESNWLCGNSAPNFILLERDRTPRCTVYHVAFDLPFPPNMLSGISAVLCWPTGRSGLQHGHRTAKRDHRSRRSWPPRLRRRPTPLQVAFSPWLGALTSAAMCLAEPKTGVCNAARVTCGLIATCRRHSAALGL